MGSTGALIKTTYPTIGYHATTSSGYQGIMDNGFSLNTTTQAGDNWGKAIYLSIDPLTREYYKWRLGDYQNNNPAPEIVVKLPNGLKMLNVDTTSFTNLDKDLMQLAKSTFNAKLKGTKLSMKEFSNLAKSSGYDGLNITSNKNGYIDPIVGGNQLVIFDPTKLKVNNKKG